MNKNIKNSLILLGIVLCANQDYAQNRFIDSLKQVLKIEPEDTDKVNTLNKLSENLWRIGKYDTSVVCANSSLSLGEKLNFKKGIAFAFKNSGLAYYFMANYTKALEFANKSLTVFLEMGNKEGVARSYTNIGNIYNNQGNDTLSLEYAKKALTISQEIRNKQLSAIILTNIKNIYQKNNDYHQELEYLNKILAINQEMGDTNNSIENFLDIGHIYFGVGNYPAALEYFFKSLKLAKDEGNKTKISNILLNVGAIYQVQKNFSKALNYDSMGLRIIQETGDKNGLASVLGNMGGIYEEKGDTAKAFECYYKSLSIAKELGNKNAIAGNLANIGTIYLKKGNYSKALEYENNSLILFREVGNKINSSLNLMITGIIYVKIRKYKLAKAYLDSALTIAQHLQYKRVLKTTYFGLAAYDSATGNYKTAFENYKMYFIYNDSLKNDDETKKMVQTEMNYNFNRKTDSAKAAQDRKDVITEADKRKQTIITWSVLGGLLLVLVFSGFIFRSLSITRKQKEVIGKQKQLVEEKNKDILDSIMYAKRLQDAILPPLSIIKQYLPESFLLYKPKDIVAGDFYWMERAGDTLLIAAADCTGHGVPGALVSVVCSNALNRTVKEFHITEPGKILDKVRELVLETFEKSENNVQDGMDISLCCINTKTKEVQWSGAYNSLWYIQHGKIHEVPADKQPIGKIEKPQPFNTHNLNLQKGDSLYLFTDGYADQFGGPKGKKFKYKQMEELLLLNAAMPMDEQRYALESTLEKWKGALEQVDDILIIGIRV